MKRFSTPKTMMLAFAGILVLFSAASITVGLLKPAFLLNENQVLYLFSTSAQVVAAIYGLTLTGFVFFRSELSREETEDETLVDAVESLKKRYLILMGFISVLVFVCLLLSNLAISQESSKDYLASAVIINAAQSAFVTSLLAIGYFIFDVLSPQRIQAESSSIKEELDPVGEGQEKGDLTAFLRNYNEVEALLQKYGTAFYYHGDLDSRGRGVRRLSNARLAEVLFRSERISKELSEQIRELVTLRNSIIHGANPVVSPELVDRSAAVLLELRSALDLDLTSR